MHSWLKHQGDIRWILPIYRRSDKDETKLSTLLYGINLYLKGNAQHKKHIPQKIILDACLSFQPKDTYGSKTAKLVTQLQEFKENPAVVDGLSQVFDWSTFINGLRDSET